MATIFEKLNQIEGRYEELTLQISSPEVHADSGRFQKLARAQSEMGEIVNRYREWKEIEKGLRGAQQMLMEAEDAGSHFDGRVTSRSHHSQEHIEIVEAAGDTACHVPQTDHVIVDHEDPVVVLLKDALDHVVADVGQPLLRVRKHAAILSALVLEVTDVGVYLGFVDKNIGDGQERISANVLLALARRDTNDKTPTARVDVNTAFVPNCC